MGKSRCSIGWLLAVLLLVSSGMAQSIDSSSDPSSAEPAQANDLAAAAKLAREQQAREKARRTEHSQAVSDMAEDLARANEEPITGAPTGYRYHYFQPGDYAILVPVDAKPVARDSYGVRLMSSETFSSQIEVVLGDPIQATGRSDEEILHNANAEYFGSCAWNIGGVGTPVNGHPAHAGGYSSNCDVARNLLGSSELVVGDGYVVPVLCGYPMTAQDLDPSPNQPIKKIVSKYDRERNGFRICDIILPSLKFHPFGNRWQPKHAPAEAEKKTIAPHSLTPVARQGSAGETSLGAFARAHKKSPTAAVMTDLKKTASGYEAYSFRYFCEKDNSKCYSATLQIPAGAKRNEQWSNPWTGLFQFEVAMGKDLVIIQANTGPPSTSGIVSREEMIATKADWPLSYFPAEHYSSVQTANVLSEELTEISGVPARLATFTNVTASQTVVTYKAAYMVPGKFVDVRCTVPEKISGDVQSLCDHVLKSMEIAQPEQDDPPEQASDEDP